MVLLWLYYLSDKSSFEYYLTYAVTVKLMYALTIRTPLTNLWKCLSTCRQIHCSTFSYSWNAIFCSGCKWEGKERNGPLVVCHLVDLEWDLCGHLLVFYHVCTLCCLPIPPLPFLREVWTACLLRILQIECMESAKGHAVYYCTIAPFRSGSIERWRWCDDDDTILRQCDGDGDAMTIERWRWHNTASVRWRWCKDAMAR